jgi:hypothetical protein
MNLYKNFLWKGIEMKAELLAEIHNKWHDRMKELLKRAYSIVSRKTSDYGKENFLISGDITSSILQKEIQPYEVAVVLLGVKLARIDSIFKKIEAGEGLEFESVEDSVIDAINYLGLMYRERIKQIERNRLSCNDKGLEEAGDKRDFSAI